MPIHYDTIEDGQNKKSHLLFSKWKYDTSLCTVTKTLRSQVDRVDIKFVYQFRPLLTK